MRFLLRSLPVAALAAIIVVPIAAWKTFLPRVRAGRVSAARGIGMYALTVLSPVVGYVALFFALVGIEELSGAALIPEEMGRSLLILVALGVLVWFCAALSFAIAAARAGKRR